jgi:hypothetical protein
MSAALFDTQNSSNYRDWTTLALPARAFAMAGFHSLSASVAIDAGTDSKGIPSDVVLCL